MRLTFRSFVVALAAIAFLDAPASAQSDILLQLRSGSPAGDRFRVDSAGGVVALGEIGWGIIPATGAGYRMMWYPFKAAFRAGSTDDGGAGAYWDDVNVGFFSWAGGNLTTAAGIYSFAMGNQNTVQSGSQAGMALGYGNIITATGSFGVAMGLNNDVMDHSGVAIGNNNTSDGDAAVAMGYYTTADADYSMALGYRASTNGHTGAKVFGDASTTDSIEAVANNEFAVRAAGGFRFRSNATLTNGCNIAAGGASITCASSRLIKENFVPVDVEDVLERLMSLELNTWNIIDEPSHALHMGLFAEDFYDAFGLGDDRRAIGHQDIDGVTVAGIMALGARTDRLREDQDRDEAELARLRAENEALRATVADLVARVERLEAAD